MSDRIIIVGLSHHTAPVEIREKLSFSSDELSAALKRIEHDPSLSEGLVFSTCNRTELIFIPENNEQQHFEHKLDPVKKMIDLIEKIKQVDQSIFRSYLYVYKDDDAIRHLFRVTSSLDSMIIGEPQILGQIKQAYKAAVESRNSGLLLNRMMHKSFSIAKKIRQETGIGNNAVSVSYAAIQLAGKIFSDLSSKKVLLLGAGEMAELAVEHLISNHVKQIFVTNRTFENALILARKFNGEAIQFEERQTALSNVDIIISSTGAAEYVLTRDQVKKVMKTRNHKTLFFIDISVPRNIDPAINRIPNAYVYDIDDLQNIVRSNMEQRVLERAKAERFIEEAVINFRKWLDSLAIVPTIKSLNDKISRIADMECEKTLSHLSALSEKEMDAIRRMTQSIASKIIHDPIHFLRNIGKHRKDSVYLDVIHQLFDLDIRK